MRKLLAQPEKLLCARDSIDNYVLPTDDDWPRRIGRPERRNEVRRGLQSEPGVVGWPRQNYVWTGRNERQLRLDENAEDCAVARTAACRCRSIQSVP